MSKKKSQKPQWSSWKDWISGKWRSDPRVQLDDEASTTQGFSWNGWRDSYNIQNQPTYTTYAGNFHMNKSPSKLTYSRLKMSYEQALKDKTMHPGFIQNQIDKNLIRSNLDLRLTRRELSDLQLRGRITDQQFHQNMSSIDYQYDMAMNNLSGVNTFGGFVGFDQFQSSTGSAAMTYTTSAFGAMNCTHCKRAGKQTLATYMLNGNSVCEECFDKISSLTPDVSEKEKDALIH